MFGKQLSETSVVMFFHCAHLVELQRVRHVLEKAFVSVVHQHFETFSFEFFGDVRENEGLYVCCCNQLTVITFALRV